MYIVFISVINTDVSALWELLNRMYHTLIMLWFQSMCIFCIRSIIFYIHNAKYLLSLCLRSQKKRKHKSQHEGKYSSSADEDAVQHGKYFTAHNFTVAFKDMSVTGIY